MARPNYYEILQVASHAEPEVIQAAYKRLSLKYHPDRNSDPSAVVRMQLLNEAFETLSDPARRKAYDDQCASNSPEDSGENRGPIRVITCPTCGTRFEERTSPVPEKRRCPHCGQKLRLRRSRESSKPETSHKVRI